MRIGIIHYKVGDTDGVSLEIEKWKIVLEKMGHMVFLAGGDLGTVDGTIIKGLFHHSEMANRLYAQTFIDLGIVKEMDYRLNLQNLSLKIESSMLSFVKENHLDLLIIENIWSVAANPAAATAAVKVLDECGIQCIAHSHDFYWERTDGVCLTSSTAVELADKYLPPRNPLIQHTVINSLAQKELFDRKGIRSVVVPNVFDFDAQPWAVDDYNRDFRQRLGLDSGDVVILQATRVVARKGIELAVDFVKALGARSRRDVLERNGLYDGRSFTSENRIVLVMSGYTHDDIGGSYVSRLTSKIEAEGIDALFIADVVSAHRTEHAGQKKYSLWDTYTLADFVTYPSLWEGWGNQLLEAVRARRPFLLYEYPVYAADIVQAGFRAVSLGSQLSGRDTQGLAQVSPDIIDKAADDTIELLTNNDVRQKVIEHNYQMARNSFSLQALRKHLEPLIDAAE